MPIEPMRFNFALASDESVHRSWFGDDPERLFREFMSDAVLEARKRGDIGDPLEWFALAVQRKPTILRDLSRDRRFMAVCSSVPRKIAEPAGPGVVAWAVCYAEQNSGMPVRVQWAVPLYRDGSTRLLVCDVELTTGEAELVR